MTTPHKHAELIKAWADGAIIQYFDPGNDCWTDVFNNIPSWSNDYDYQVKPSEPKKVKMWNALYKSDNWFMCSSGFFTSEEEAKNAYTHRFIKLLPHTEIEIEVAE